jgi:hypothetical protein
MGTSDVLGGIDLQNGTNSGGAISGVQAGVTVQLLILAVAFLKNTF